ncbi:hypothetical protein RvY_04609 [Ramazzottius varieornatus]|uniref:Uncharacterized protein n=1 Tax=Ramazzottius varieornatus TaxID=947166 RepID=A0A1D1UVI4_RAMVA|nr:hypothetical protein RvY_04609 [Ramazzottius varieornatus]
MDPGRLEVSLLTRGQIEVGHSSRYQRIPLRNKLMSQSSRWLQRHHIEKFAPITTNNQQEYSTCYLYLD